jgi:ribosomal protein S18 acetylase RimI-like enzyme
MFVLLLQAAGVERYTKVMILATHPSAQGQGLGSALLASISADADAQNSHLYLEAANEGAARLYARHGYQTLAKVTEQGKEMVLMLQEPSGSSMDMSS